MLLDYLLGFNVHRDHIRSVKNGRGAQDGVGGGGRAGGGGASTYK